MSIGVGRTTITVGSGAGVAGGGERVGSGVTLGDGSPLAGAPEGWAGGFIAHHYTRYLGDLSGGQAIARLVSRQHGFEGDGVAFYDFAELGPIPHFKKAYREALDSLGAELSDAERQRMCDEVREAYRFNTETFRDLDVVREKTAA